MKQNADYPRVLVISHNCFSKTDSNGRTLSHFFSGWPKDRLAQFYIQDADPDFAVCDKYFRVTDAQAVAAWWGKRGGGVVAPLDAEPVSSSSASSSRRPRRNALTMMARNAVWNGGAWKRSGFYAWADAFAPQAVLLQAGDNAFMFALARKAAARYGVPLLIYNSEGYYFKKFDYFRAKGPAHWCYPVFRWGFCREFRRTQRCAAYNFYICDDLRLAYEREFDTPAVTLYTASDCPVAVPQPHEGFVVSYLGNLGLGRHEGLVAIAETLQGISKDYRLDVYGKIPNDAVGDALAACDGICYRGFLDYEGVVTAMGESDLLVHTESFDPFYTEDLRFAFSTKIADSLACGRCFLLYAPATLACYRYLNENSLAYTVDTLEDLTATLRLLAQDPAARERYVANARQAARERHSVEVNRMTFAAIITETVGAAHEGATSELCLPQGQHG